MKYFKIIELIERRTKYPLGHEIGDKWIDEILKNDDETAYFITTENLSTLTNVEGRNKKRILFETYYISGIFGLSNPIVGTAVNLMLLVLKKGRMNSNSIVLSGTYNNGLYYGRSYRFRIDENSVPLDIYPVDFIEYCEKIERWVIEGLVPSDGDCYKYHEFSSQYIDIDKVYPQYYSKEVFDIYNFLKHEKTVPLASITSVIRPRPIRGERAKVISARNFSYPLSYEKVDEGSKTDTMIIKGDIICKNGMTDKIYLLMDDIKEEIYAGANDIVIRPHNTEESAYIFSYIQSDTGKTVISANTTGTVLPRMTIRYWEQLPIITPKRPLIEYEKYFKIKYYKQKSASDYNTFFSTLTKIEDSYNIEDVLNIEMIRTVKLYKGEAIREFLEEDLKELNACFRVKAYKATLILCGSILEAVLIDWVSEKNDKNYFEEEFYISNGNGRKKANLVDYINTIKEIEKPKWMEEAEKAHEIRKKRNLVHAKLCLKSDDINETVCREVIDYLKDILKTRGFIMA